MSASFFPLFLLASGMSIWAKGRSLGLAFVFGSIIEMQSPTPGLGIGCALFVWYVAHIPAWLHVHAFHPRIVQGITFVMIFLASSIFMMAPSLIEAASSQKIQTIPWVLALGVQDIGQGLWWSLIFMVFAYGIFSIKKIIRSRP